MPNTVDKGGKKAVDAQTDKFAPKTLAGKMAEIANQDVFLASVRQMLTVIGGIMLYFNIIPDANLDGVQDTNDMTALVGAIMVVVGVGTSLWNAIKNYRRKKLLVTTQVIAPQTVELAANLVAETTVTNAANKEAKREAKRNGKH